MILKHSAYRFITSSFPYKKSTLLYSSVAKVSIQKTMSNHSVTPPPEVSGMKELNRAAFKRTVEIPTVVVPVSKLSSAVKALKASFLKLPKLNPVQEEGETKAILIDPSKYHEKPEFFANVEKEGLGSLIWKKYDLSYDNWTAENIFKAVLPPDTVGNVSSFSIIGHIIHLNLKTELMDYKHLIGQVLLDKNPPIKTVVNKVRTIDNEFRNFNMELLAGKDNYDVLVKENHCVYEFDFSKVFWNPRLVHEHDLIVQKVQEGDEVYDVFAGVGPFAVPIAKKKVHVYANDLNPHSFYWLMENARLNKVEEYLHAYNGKGENFIQTFIKHALISFWKNNDIQARAHILMNLPGSALEFLKYFRGLFTKRKIEKIGQMPYVYCYFFLKKDETVADVLRNYFDERYLDTLEIRTVRCVAPNKRMMCVEYQVEKAVLFGDIEEIEPPSSKRIKTEYSPSDVQSQD